jgi:hypothetical protein
MPTSIDLVIPAFNVGGIIEHTLKRISEHKLTACCASGKNVGRSEARNNGARAGSGSIIVMCDAYFDDSASHARKVS